LDAALIHTDRGDWGGVLNLLRRSFNYLSICPAEMMGIDVALLRQQILECLQEVEAIKKGKKQKFNWRLKPTLKVKGIVPPTARRLRRSKHDGPHRN